MKDDFRPKRRQNLQTQNLVDELIIIDMQKQVVHVFNPSAQLIWSLCDGQHTVAEIATAMQQRYAETSLAVIDSDLTQVLSEMNAKDLLVAA